MDRTDWAHSHKGQAVGGVEEGGKMNSSNITADFLRPSKLTEPNHKKKKKKSVNNVNILKFVIFVAAVM